MIKVGLIGVGGMGGCHRDVYKKMEDVQLVAIADIRTEMAKEKAADDSIHIYSSIEELLEKETVDYVDICTPSYMHADMAIYALEKGVNVLCEKPMVLNSADGERVLAAAKKSGKSFMTAHVVRFMKPYMYLRQIINSKELGNPLHITMSRVSATPKWSWDSWMLSKERSGLTPIDLNIHDVDYMQSVFGMPKSISSVYSEIKNDTDFIVTNYIYDGFVVTTEATWYNTDIPFAASFRAVFENGTVVLKGGKLYKNNEEVALDSDEDSTATDTGINIGKADGYDGEIRYFVDCLKSGTAPCFVTPESSLDSVKLIEKTLDAATKI